MDNWSRTPKRKKFNQYIPHSLTVKPSSGYNIQLHASMIDHLLIAEAHASNICPSSKWAEIFLLQQLIPPCFQNQKNKGTQQTNDIFI